MYKVLFFLFGLLILSGCYTQRTAKRQVIRAQMEYPKVVASGCAEWYPPKDSFHVQKEYIPGKDSIIVDTFVVDCTAQGNKGKKVPVPYSKGTLRVDTFRHTIYNTTENTAKRKVLQAEVDKWKQRYWLSTGLGCALLIFVLIFSLFKYFKNGNKK